MPFLLLLEVKDIIRPFETCRMDQFAACLAYYEMRGISHGDPSGLAGLLEVDVMTFAIDYRLGAVDG